MTIPPSDLVRSAVYASRSQLEDHRPEPLTQGNDPKELRLATIVAFEEGQRANGTAARVYAICGLLLAWRANFSVIANFRQNRFFLDSSWPELSHVIVRGPHCSPIRTSSYR